MKKQIIALLLGSCFIVPQLSAQEKDSVVTMPTLTVTSGAAVPKEINKAFMKSFPEAQNLEWYKVNKDFLAKFIQNDMKHRTLFAKQGYVKYDISYGNESNLPAEMKDKIKGAYEDYKISHVANVKEAGRNIWVVNLQSLNHLVLVRLEDEEMEEVGKYNNPN